MNTYRPALHVAFNITASYASLCAITLHSLCSSNTHRTVIAHIVATGMTPEAKTILTHVAIKWKATIYYYDASQVTADLAQHYHNKRYHISVCYRIFLADLLPTTLDRVLYLDCDILVRGNLSPLYDRPLSADTAVAAVRDEPIYFAGKHPRRVQHELREAYFNSGVLLINLAYWRKHNVSATCVTHYRQAPADYPFPDQDLLNEALQGHVDHISPHWNCLSYFFTHQFYEKPGIGTIDYDLLHTAPIIHFINRNKPWTARCTHPYREAYLDQCCQAVGKAWIAQQRTIGYYIFRPIYRLLIMLGFKKSYIKLT